MKKYTQKIPLPFKQEGGEDLKEMLDLYNNREEIFNQLSTTAYKMAQSIINHVFSSLNDIDYGRYEFTEDGTARLIVDLLQGVYHYVPDLKGDDFFYYNGVWKSEDLLPEVIRFITIIRTNFVEGDNWDFKQREHHLKVLVTNKGIQAIKALIRVDPKIKETSERFDKNKYLVVFKNGTYDLKADTFRNYSPADYSTLSVNVDYDREACCPVFETVLSDVMEGRKDDLIFIQQWVGYGLSGFINEHAVLIANGSGENGKSTIFNALLYAFGGYGATLPITTLMKQKDRSNTNDLAGLRGKRFIVAAEAEQGERFDESLIKTLTGEDRIQARFLYKEYIEFIPQFILTLHTNYLPVIRGADHGIWRRLKILPFAWRVPHDKKNPELPEKLKKEAPGILLWAIEGYRMWKSERLSPTEGMEQALNEYRKASDYMAGYILDHCKTGPEYECKSREIHQDYLRWAEIKEKPCVSLKTFSRDLEQRGYNKKRKAHGTFFKGITPMNLQDNTDLKIM